MKPIRLAILILTVLALARLAGAQVRPDVPMPQRTDGTEALSSIDDGEAVRQLAEPPVPNQWEKHPFTLELELGVATPVGAIGAMFDWAPVSAMSIGCGAGTNLFGIEGACMLRARVLRSSTRAIDFGIGGSMGRHQQQDTTQGGAVAIFTGPLAENGEDRYPSESNWSLARWLNFELDYEWRARSTFAGRVYGGLSLLLNPGDGVPSEPLADIGQHYRLNVVTTYLYTGVGLGKAL